MIFDDRLQVQVNPDGAEQSSIAETIGLDVGVIVGVAAISDGYRDSKIDTISKIRYLADGLPQDLRAGALPERGLITNNREWSVRDLPEELNCSGRARPIALRSSSSTLSPLCRYLDSDRLGFEKFFEAFEPSR